VSSSDRDIPVAKVDDPSPRCTSGVNACAGEDDGQPASWFRVTCKTKLSEPIPEEDDEESRDDGGAAIFTYSPEDWLNWSAVTFIERVRASGPELGPESTIFRPDASKTAISRGAAVSDVGDRSIPRSRVLGSLRISKTLEGTAAFSSPKTLI